MNLNSHGILAVFLLTFCAVVVADPPNIPYPPYSESKGVTRSSSSGNSSVKWDDRLLEFGAYELYLQVNDFDTLPFKVPSAGVTRDGNEFWYIPARVARILEGTNATKMSDGETEQWVIYLNPLPEAQPKRYRPIFYGEFEEEDTPKGGKGKGKGPEDPKWSLTGKYDVKDCFDISMPEPVCPGCPFSITVNFKCGKGKIKVIPPTGCSALSPDEKEGVGKVTFNVAKACTGTYKIIISGGGIEEKITRELTIPNDKYDGDPYYTPGLSMNMGEELDVLAELFSVYKTFLGLFGFTDGLAFYIQYSHLYNKECCDGVIPDELNYFSQRLDLDLAYKDDLTFSKGKLRQLLNGKNVVNKLSGIIGKIQKEAEDGRLWAQHLLHLLEVVAGDTGQQVIITGTDFATLIFDATTLGADLEFGKIEGAFSSDIIYRGYKYDCPVEVDYLLLGAEKEQALINGKGDLIDKGKNLAKAIVGNNLRKAPRNGSLMIQAGGRIGTSLKFKLGPLKQKVGELILADGKLSYRRDYSLTSPYEKGDGCVMTERRYSRQAGRIRGYIDFAILRDALGQDFFDPLPRGKKVNKNKKNDPFFISLYDEKMKPKRKKGKRDFDSRCEDVCLETKETTSSKK